MRAVYRHPIFGHFHALATTRALGVGTVCSRMRQRARNETELIGDVVEKESGAFQRRNAP